MATTVRTTVTLSKEAWKEFQKRCIDLEISYTDGLDQALRHWLDNVKAMPRPRPKLMERDRGG